MADSNQHPEPRSFNDIAFDIVQAAPEVDQLVEEWFVTLSWVKAHRADPAYVHSATEAVCAFDPDAAAYRQRTEAWVRVALSAVAG